MLCRKRPFPRLWNRLTYPDRHVLQRHHSSDGSPNTHCRKHRRAKRIDQAIAESLPLFLDDVQRKDEDEPRLRDAEARRLREQEGRTRRAEDRLDTALMEARMAYWEWDLDADQVTASRTMDDLFGLPPGQQFVTSRHDYTLLHPGDRVQYKARMTEARRHRTGWHCQVRIIRPLDAKVVWLEERAMPIAHDVVDKRVFMTGLVGDVTERPQWLGPSIGSRADSRHWLRLP